MSSLLGLRLSGIIAKKVFNDNCKKMNVSKLSPFDTFCLVTHWLKMPTISRARGISVNFYTSHASYVCTLDSEIVLTRIKSKKLKYKFFFQYPTFCISYYCQTDALGNTEHLKGIDYATFGGRGCKKVYYNDSKIEDKASFEWHFPTSSPRFFAIVYFFVFAPFVSRFTFL